jgi:hypothetical protein
VNDISDLHMERQLGVTYPLAAQSRAWLVSGPDQGFRLSDSTGSARVLAEQYSVLVERFARCLGSRVISALRCQHARPSLKP